MNATATHPPPPPLSKGGNEGVEALIGRLADEFTERLNRGEKPSIAEYAERYPEHAQVIRQVLGALELIRASSASAYAVTSPAAAVTMDAETGTLGDFRLLREVGRGGMGVVYEAEQISLGRRVALKVLPFASTLDSRQLQRFKNEAQAAAHLHHTNIVPVFATGVERGVHYYAMQFIDGQTLAEVIEELRNDECRVTNDGSNDESRMTNDERMPNDEARMTKETPGELRHSTLDILSSLGIRHSSFFRTVAQLGIQAAEALEHAHQLGIVHRDVKPGNLLLEADAATRGHGDTARSELDSVTASPRPRVPASSSLRLWITDFGLAQMQTDTRLTLTGDILGTLRYMSPESALAKRVIVDHRTDIYSLGVTLYELLTLEPAFPGQDRQELLRQIAFEEPKPPRRLRPNIPRELETIVLKAMAKNPDERYATARELADDLGRFLKDEPIRARRPTLVQRARKWARRHQAVVWSALLAGGGGLLAALVALIFGIIAVNQEKEQTKSALEKEAKRKQEARNHLDDLTSFMIGSALARQEALTDEHREFLRKALQAYEEFARDVGEDPEVRAAVAEANFRVGRIRHQFAEVAEAEAAYRTALAGYEQVAGEFPAHAAYRNGAAECHKFLAIILDQTGRRAEAEVSYAEAVPLLKRLVAEFPRSPEYQFSLAEILNNLGMLLAATGRPSQAESAFREAVAVHQGLAAKHQQTPPSRMAQSKCWNNLAVLLSETGRLAEAETSYREALAITAELVREFPKNAYYRGELAGRHSNLGNLFRKTGRPAEAETALREALRIFKQVTADFPAVPAYKRMLAETLINMGVLYWRTNRPQEAEAAYREAAALLKQLVVDFPAVHAYRQILAKSYSNLASTLDKTRRSTEAETLLREAIGLHRALAEANPTVPDHRDNLANAHNSLGLLLQAGDRLDDAEAALRQAVAFWTQLAAELPAMPDYRNGLAGGMVNLADLLWKRQQLQAARELLEQAKPHHLAALQANPRHPSYRRYYRSNRMKLASLLCASGDHMAAAAAAEEVAQLDVDPAEDSYDAAVYFALCVDLAQKDSDLPPAQQQERAQTYGTRAVELLRLAIQRGLKNPKSLETDKRLNPLREREDFKKLQAELNARQKPA